jgi:hypothetical protein
VAFDSNESSRWAQAVSAATTKYRQTVDKLMTDAAARGFMAPPGQYRLAVVESALEAKQELVKANADIYKARREMLAKDDEVEQKYILKLMKVDVEAYRLGLENAYHLEEAKQAATLDEYRAQIDRLNTDTDKRQVRIIMEKAEVERQITYWKRLQLAAESQSLDAESQLIKEKIKTAEVKLATLAYMDLILAAERLVLTAEKKKSEALVKVVAASQRVADIKKSMIPLYLQKADARKDQAEAVIKESEDKRLLELLGYDKVELARQKHMAEHEESLAEAIFEQAKLDYVRADRLTEILRNQARRLLTEYETHIRKRVLAIQKTMGLEKAGLSHIASLIKTQLDTKGDMAYYTAQLQAAINEGSAEVASTKAVGDARVSQILASATQKTKRILKEVIERQSIRSGGEE